MNGIRYLLPIVSLILAAVVPAAAAGDSPVGTMAGIVMEMNHYPSAEEKAELKAIMKDKESTAGEKTLATVLLNMQHSVGGSDAKKLRTLAGNMKASDAERELADILLGFNHMASSGQKKRLKALMD